MKCRKYPDLLHFQNGTSVVDSEIHKFSDFYFKFETTICRKSPDFLHFQNGTSVVDSEVHKVSVFYFIFWTMKCRKYPDFLHFQNGTQWWAQNYTNFLIFILNSRP